MCFIELTGMKFHSFIGHFDEEKHIGDNFNIDIKIKTDCEKAAKTDKLKDALDYQEVYKIIKQQMQIKCNLLENVANRIIEQLFSQFTQITEIELKVSKLSPKLGGIVNKVSVIMHKKRNK